MEKEKITIDGIEYVKKGKENTFQEVKRFNFNKMSKLIVSMKKHFSLVENPISEEEALIKVKCVIDPAKVGMISGKSEEAKRLLSYFVDKEDVNDKELPELKGYDEEEGACTFSLEYIKPFMNILSITDEKVKIRVKRNYPITLENKDFIIILAPRIETEDEE